MSKVYVASGFPWKAQISTTNIHLNQMGFNVVSTWSSIETGPNTPEADGLDAFRDINEVAEADILLAIMNDNKYAYRGTCTEIGTAIALKKLVIIVCNGLGEEFEKSKGQYHYPYYCMSNVFFWHPQIIRVKTFEDAVNIMKVHAKLD